MDGRIPALLVLAVILVSGCTGAPSQTPATRNDINEATLACVSECEKVLKTGADLSPGPCITNNLTKNWVCDVAHAPRLPADNNPENQCTAYGVTADHFVEVDPKCSFIRAV